MMITLKEMVETAVTNLRAALKGVADPIRTVAALNRMISLARISPVETLATGRAAIRGILEFSQHAEDHCRYVLADHLSGIARDVDSVLAGWYSAAGPAEKAARRTWDRGEVCTEVVARWKSRGGKHWVDLRHGRYDYGYDANGSHGSICNPNLTVEEAVTVVEAMLARGCFLPDSAVLPMKRVR